MIKRQTFPHAVRLEIAASQGWKCSMCQQLLPAHHHVDHITPLHFGGTNDRENLQCLCPNCHQEKTSKERLSLRYHEIDKYEQVAQAMCLRCQTVFSPYFIHKCNFTTSQQFFELP